MSVEFDIKSYYDTYITTDAIKNELNGRLVNQAITSTADLKNKIKEALVLTIVHNPSGYTNIKTVFEAFKTELGLTSVSADMSVYKNLVGNYASVDKMLEKYASLIKSGGSSGSSSNNSISSGIDNSTVIVDIPIQKNDEVKMPFDDLDTVSWAYEAISALSDANIISGKSETKFAPRDKVKREEFVKMTVGALNENQASCNNVFEDIEENAWYTGYVLKAYEMNIINGISDNMFGTGENITRQDMTVVIYQALLSQNIELETTELNFEDKDLISDYAVKAVSVLVNAGIVSGLEDNTFNPSGDATRAEAARMIYGMYNVIK